MRNLARRHFLRLAQYDAFDVFSALLLAAVTVVALRTFRDYAISNDEEVQHRYGELIIAYYASGFADQSVFHFKNLFLYGGLFDVIAVGLARLMAVEPYALRHILCALAGIGGIAAACGTARLIAGPRAGALAACALAACGPWYGAMFNHTKDIPFAAAMMAAIFILVRAARDFPRPRLRHALAFGMLLGAALGIRVTGLFLIGCLGLVIALCIPVAAGWREALRFAMRSLAPFLPALVLAYLIMIAAWPWAALAPLNPIRGLTEFAHFHYQIPTLLSGHVYYMADVPRWYVPIYFLIKLPIILLLGVVLAVAFLVAGWQADPRNHRDTIFLIFVGGLPLFGQVLLHGPAFTGLRHFLFVVPPLAVLAGTGLDAALNFVETRQRAIAIGAFAAVAAGFIWNATMLVRLHPHQYLFYNPLVGGLDGAARRYDTDYWVNIMPEAINDLEAFLDKTERDHRKRPGQHYTVAVCGERLPFEKETDPRLQWTSDWQRADFFIAPTHMNCDRALNGKVIVTISRLNVAIGVVKDRRALTRPDIAHNR